MSFEKVVAVNVALKDGSQDQPNIRVSNCNWVFLDGIDLACAIISVNLPMKPVELDLQESVGLHVKASGMLDRNGKRQGFLLDGRVTMSGDMLEVSGPLSRPGMSGTAFKVFLFTCCLRTHTRTN